jgi:hypothetical protein
MWSMFPLVLGTLRSLRRTALVPSLSASSFATRISPDAPLAPALVDCGSSERNLTTPARRPNLASMRTLPLVAAALELGLG